MAEIDLLFSEAWHLVAPLRIKLRPDLHVRRQIFHGEPWFVVEDGMNRAFFRIRPAAHRFLGRLEGRRTVDEVWKEGVDRDPQNTPGQQEVVQLVARLAEASLIQGELAADSLRQFTQQQRRRARNFRTQAVNFLFLRIPLADPDGLLTRLAPLA